MNTQFLISTVKQAFFIAFLDNIAVSTMAHKESLQLHSVVGVQYL